jgi:nucleotide-binding universal stress UspA family protein
MRILFATDGSRGAAVAEDFLLALPLSCDDDITVVTVPSGSETEAHDVISKCRWRLAQHGVGVTTLLVRHGSPADIIDSVALERAAELIVIGSRGLGTLAGAVLGSMARTLARSAPVPVLVVRSRREAPRHVLLAVDDSTDGRAAVDELVKLPMPSAAGITLVHILAAATGEPASLDIGEYAREHLGERITDRALVERGHVGDEVLRRAIVEGTDLIVLGARDQTQGTGLLNTSVADHVLANAHCAVLVAKAPLAVRTLNRRVGACAVALGVAI